jgi:hypothetical protein
MAAAEEGPGNRICGCIDFDAAAAKIGSVSDRIRIEHRAGESIQVKRKRSDSAGIDLNSQACRADAEGVVELHAGPNARHLIRALIAWIELRLFLYMIREKERCIDLL